MTLTKGTAAPAPVRHMVVTIGRPGQGWRLYICVDSPPRRGLSRLEAAAYIGVSPSRFDQLVRDGRMPKPKRIDGRLVWDIRELDIAFDDFTGGATDPDEDTWSDFLWQ